MGPPGLGSGFSLLALSAAFVLLEPSFSLSKGTSSCRSPKPGTMEISAAWLWGEQKDVVFFFIIIVGFILYFFSSCGRKGRYKVSLFPGLSEKENEYCLLSVSCSLLWLSYPTRPCKQVTATSEVVLG